MNSNVLSKNAKAVVGNPLGCNLSKGKGHIGILFINLDKLQTNAESVKKAHILRNARQRVAFFSHSVGRRFFIVLLA